MRVGEVSDKSGCLCTIISLGPDVSGGDKAAAKHVASSTKTGSWAHK